MPLETANYIFDLVPTNPPDTDLVQQGDDHIRLIKKVIQQTWPGLTGPNLPTSTGSANAQVVTHVYGPAAYVAGQIVTFKAGFTNTGPTTINVNGGGPVTLSQGGAALTAGAVVAGNNYTMIYDPSVTGFALIASSMGYLPLAGGTLSGNLSIAATSPVLTLNKVAGANANYLVGSVAGLGRWQLMMGNGAAETGGNVGSDFALQRFTDAGAFIDTPLTIQRSNGIVTLSATLYIVNAESPQVVMNKTSGGGSRAIIGQQGSTNRWVAQFGNSTAEGGSNTGSDFQLDRFNDAGTYIDSPLAITRSTGTVTTTQQLRAGQSTSGTTAGMFCGGAGIAYNAYGTNAIAYNWTGSALQAIVNNTNVGTITITSDYRIKRDIAPLPSMWERIKALKPISYKHKDWSVIKSNDVERWGFVAHELQETLTDDAASGKKDEEDVIQSPNLMAVVAALTKALQEAMARIENLETQLGVQHG